MQNEFYIGQRVVVDFKGREMAGAVRSCGAGGYYDIGIEFDEKSGWFHTLGGLCAPNHGRWFRKNDTNIRPLESPIRYDSSWDELWS